MWPQDAHLENYYTPKSGFRITPVIRFMFGLSHANDHLGQMKDIVQQAKEAGS
ncbi:MAG: hypothetical protein N2D54_07380 [Chloroflexota bacterium]